MILSENRFYVAVPGKTERVTNYTVEVCEGIDNWVEHAEEYDDPGGARLYATATTNATGKLTRIVRREVFRKVRT